MDKLQDFIETTYVTVEHVPHPYGAFHLIFVVVSLVLIVAVCYSARKSRDKTFRIVMFSIGALLLLSEVYKQFYYFYAVDEVGYDWDSFPFQLCSVPMYLSMVVGCMRKGKVRDALCEYLVTVGMLGGIMAYAEPSGILHEDYFTLIHSCTWHALLIFIGLYILFTGNACRKLKDYKKALIVLGGVVLMATVLNFIFHSRPDFNMCYISPYYNTPLAVFSSFDTFFQGFMGQYPGRVLSILIYIASVALGGFLIYAAAYFVKKKLQKDVQVEMSAIDQFAMKK